MLTWLRNKLNRRRWDTRRGKYKSVGQETLYIRELGGEVHIRGLSQTEMLEAIMMAERQPTEDRYYGVYAARLLGYGIVDPAIGHERAPDLMVKHAPIAARLGERITKLTIRNLERYGQITK